MPRLKTASVSDLAVLERGFTSATEVRNRAGSRVSFPIDGVKLADQIGWSEAFSFRRVSGNELVAFGQLMPKPAGRLHLARLIINPAYRGKGYGRRLSEAIVEEALSLRPAVISLNVFPANKPAFKLYKRIGFVSAARAPDESPSQAEYMVYEDLTNFI